MCTITVISRSPYRAEKKDCGSCGCDDSSNYNNHRWAQMSDRKWCEKCGESR